MVYTLPGGSKNPKSVVGESARKSGRVISRLMPPHRFGGGGGRGGSRGGPPGGRAGRANFRFGNSRGVGRFSAEILTRA